MPLPIILPKFGFTLEMAEIVQWLKKDGDTVRAGDPICEVTTDKVNMEVEAPESGTFISPLYEAGASVPVTAVIAYLLKPGETRPSDLPRSTDTNPTPVSVPPSTNDVLSSAVSPVALRIAEASNIDLNQIKGTGPNNRILRRDVENAIAHPSDKIRATPAARHLARQSGIALEHITGTGPRGRIQSADVEAAKTAEVTHAAAGSPALHAAPTTGAPPENIMDAPRIIKLEGMRRTIATRLQQSFQSAPHIFFDAQINTSGIDGLRQTLKARHEKLSITTILVKACASVLMRHPWLNATIEREDIALWPTANIGVAVALEAGLVVPVVHSAERRSMQAIQTLVDELAKRARDNTLKVSDMVDGTFTISNLGMFGVDRFTAIINPPQVAILAVGRTQQQFVPDSQGQPCLRSFMTLTLSADHRVVDGAQVARFLQDLRTVLEEPALLAW